MTIFKDIIFDVFFFGELSSHEVHQKNKSIFGYCWTARMRFV